jgi:hypothetical protein
MISQDGPIVVEADPLGLLIQPIAHWNVEVWDLAVVEGVSSRWLIKGVLVVEDALFKAAELAFVPFVGQAGAGFLIGNSL